MELATVLDITKVAVGLLYLYLEYHARRALWVVGVIMPAIGMVLFWQKGLYADMGLNFYYLAVALYGFIVWRKGSHGDSSKAGREIKMSSVRWHTALVLATVWLAAWGLIAWILVTFTDSQVPWLDSFTTSLSFVGMWMLARKYIQQWFVWFVVDAVYVYLYYYKGVYFSSGLYLFYTAMAIAGYLKWKKLMRLQDE